MTFTLRSLFNCTRRTLLVPPPPFKPNICHLRLPRGRHPWQNDSLHQIRPQHTSRSERGEINALISDIHHVLQTAQDPNFIDNYIHRRLDRLIPLTTKPHVVYGEVISALIGKQRCKDAVTVYERMLAEGIVPLLQTQAELIAAALAQSQSDTEVQRALDAIVLDPKYTEQQLLCLIDTLAQLGVLYDHIMRVAALFVKTRGEGYTPSELMFTKLVDIQTRAGQLENAFDAVIGFDSKRLSRPAPYVTMMRALNKTNSSNWDAFHKVLEQMKVQHVDPDIDVLNALISRELRQNELGPAFTFYRVVVQLSKNTSTSPNPSTFAPLFKLLARTYRADTRTARFRARRGPDDVIHPRQLFHDMLFFQKRSGFPVTAPFLNIILRAFIYTHDYIGAYVVLGAFRAFMLQPTRNTYLMVMQHLLHRIRIDTRMGRKVGLWRWGERFMGLTSIHGVKKLRIEDDFADKILGSACRPRFELTGHLFAYLREPAVETAYKVPPWAVIEGEESLPLGCTFALIPLRRILRRAAFAALDTDSDDDASAVINPAIKQAREEMLPRAGGLYPGEKMAEGDESSK